MRLYLVSALVIALLAIAFALQNANLVTINLFIWQFRGSLSLVLLATLAIGVVVGLLFSIPAIIRRGWKSGRFKHQAESLEGQLRSQQESAQAEAARVEQVRHSYEDLLMSLNLMDRKTGLLHHKSLPQTLASLVDRLSHNPEDGQRRSVCLLLFQAERAEEKAINPVEAQMQLTQRAIATILQKNAAVDSWLYSDGQGQFACTVTGLTLKEAGRYGEALQGFLIDNPLALKDGSTVAVNVSVGGTFCDRDHPVDQNTLLAQAKEALAHAQNRGRNRFRLLQARD